METINLEEMYQEKRNYVERDLLFALLPLGMDVAFLVYDRDEKTKSEVVIIHYFGGHEDRINVTCNSLSAICMETVRQVIAHDARGYIPEK